MARPKGQPKLGGRQKGTPNKVTAAAKDAIAQAASDLGGGKRIVEWARSDPKNEAAFWTTIYPKLIPVQVGGDPDNPLELNIRSIALVAGK